MRDRALNASYLERKLRAIGLAGSAPLEDLKDLQGLLVLESDRPEWAKPAGEMLAGAALGFTAVAAQQTAVELRNPPNSGIVIIVESVLIAASAATIMRLWLSLGVGDLPTSGAGSRIARDTRGLLTIGDGVGAVLSSDQAAAPAVGGRTLVNVRAGADATVELVRAPIILGPGSQLFAEETTVNVGAGYTLSWRERPLDGLYELK